jgi:general secretion pathway protein G
VGQKGLTFIELLITITVLAILASVIMPLSQMTVKRQKELELRRNLRIIRTAIDGYKKVWDEGRIIKKFGESGYPPELSILVEGVDDAKSPESGKKIRFLRRIPRDPMEPDKTLPPEETWGLRSYESDPDNPREGDDVFDVYSKSEEIAIDGTFYYSW